MLDVLFDRIRNFDVVHHAGALIALATFAAAAVVSLAVQIFVHRRQLSLTGMIDHGFPVRKWLSKSSRTDIVMYIVGRLINGVLSIGDAALTLLVATAIQLGLALVFTDHQPWEASAPAMIAVSILLIVCADFGGYATHRLQHRVPFLWELHKVHHSAAFMTPLTAFRMHPLGDKIDHLGASACTALPAGIGMFLFGLDLPDLLILMVSAQLITATVILEALRHSHFPVSLGPLDRVLISPHMHQLHHSIRPEHWDRNFGYRLSIWDWMFGTAVIPAKGEVITYGTGHGEAHDDRYHSLYGAYVLPVVEMVRVGLKRKTPPAPLASKADT